MLIANSITLKKTKLSNLTPRLAPIKKNNNTLNKLSCTHQYISLTGSKACQKICICTTMIFNSFAFLTCPLSIIDQN